MIRRPIDFDTAWASTDNVSPMEVTLALLADAANVSQEGKLNILGTFNSISASQFPSRHPAMQLVLRLEASPAEAKTQKKLEVKLMDEDANAVGGAVAEFAVPEARSGRRIRMQIIMPINDAVFPKPGDYSFAVLVDGRTEAEVTLSLTKTSEGGGDVD